MSPTVPDWLNRALHDRVYQEAVFRTLLERERSREQARLASRLHQKKVITTLFGIAGDSTPHENYHVTEGARVENRRENRYRDVEPFDRTRVIVEPDAQGKGRYLNANWVRELHGGKWWIATQAPLPNTMHTFLSLLLQPNTRPPPHLTPSWSPGPCRIRTVVQLTVAAEGKATKAHPYFPSVPGESYIITPPEGFNGSTLKITLVEEEHIGTAHCIKSIVRLVHCSHPVGEPDQDLYYEVVEIGEPVHFTHLLFTHWPDFGVPEEPEEKAGLLSFARIVTKTNLAPPPFSSRGSTYHPDPPISVNCSAGIGRTGSFIALCSLLRYYGLLSPAYSQDTLANLPPLPPSPLGELPRQVAEDKVASEVDSLREQRTSMVQRPEQQMLVYELLAAAFYEAGERR